MILYSPQYKGICLNILTKTPKKPNSALRKIAKVKLLKLNKIVLAHIPGEKHSLQVYNIVLVIPYNVRDLPLVKYRIIRGALNVQGVINRKRSRSKYGCKK